MGIYTKVGKTFLKKKPKAPKTASAGGGKRGNGGKKTPSVKPYMGKGEKQIEGVGEFAHPKIGRISPGGKARRQGTAKAGMSLKEKNKLAYQKGNMSKKKYFESLPANDPDRLKYEWNGLLAGAKRAIKVNIMKGKKSKFANLLQKKVIKKTGGTVKRSTGGRIGIGAALRGGGAVRKR